jgi:hypothetical protein
MQRSSSTSSPTRTGCRSRRTSPRPRSGQRSAELWAHRTLDAGGARGYCCVRHGADGACARREAAGGRHRVTVWNRTKGKAGELVAAGAREADHHPGHDDAIRAVAFSELRSSIGEATTSVDSSMVSPRLSGEPPRPPLVRRHADPRQLCRRKSGQATFLVGGKARGRGRRGRFVPQHLDRLTFLREGSS